MGDKEQHIRLRAYHIWEPEGRGDGQAEDHWREAESEVERELAQPAVQVVEPQEPTKRKANGAGKPSAAKKPVAKAAIARVHASEAGTAKKKPPGSRSKEASSDAKTSRDAKPSGAAELSGASAKPASTRSRRASPT